MSALFGDSCITPLADFSSDHDLTAQTAQRTVMAEQVSHNVVDNPGSTSASLADVSANTTIVPSADYGVATENFPETKTANLLDAAQASNQYATQSNELTSSMIADAQAIFEAEPSAGDVTEVAPGAEVVTDQSGFGNGGDEYAQLVNGVHETAGLADAQTDEEGVREGSVDVSLHSDTEGSRGDASEVKKDETHHVRTNSVKKPTSFSKVSVTKNFLAKSATSTTPIAKPGDKNSPAGTPLQSSIAKPRLIAKTGTNLRDVQKARLGAESTGGPDASKVWNKNRPVAPPPPKQFTDEELKQQYGIHLATRLQADENGKESKWADIDDDEDDWAPDTVVWMDGTKSTLTPTEVATLAQQEQKAAAPQLQTKPSEGVKPILAPKKIELGPAKTILKPGASAAAAQAKQTESGSNISGEKVSLTAKSPAALPSKSPWAVLPPIDKVSPVNPPVQQRQPPPMPFSSQDARAYEPAPPSVPAREIAADTFDRSWREGEGGTRELFNSANGRYEPVPEGGRRGSMKPDSSHRKPSVLQRPSPSGSGPAEPSAAFQTRSTSQQMDGAFTRRRGSSVSHGSIPSDRRMSISRTSEMSPAPERRTSTVVGHDMRTSPKMARNEPSQPPSFSQQSVWQQQMPPRPESGDAEAEDPVQVQARVMREKRELAKKRREEEEARLEAEKQARLQAKLADLGTAGKSRKQREAEAAAAAAAAQTPVSETAPQTAAVVSESSEAQRHAAEVSAEAAPTLEAQSILPAPDAVPAKQPTPEEALPTPLPPKDPSAERRTSATDHMQREQARLQPSPMLNARGPFQQPGMPYKASSSSYSSPGERKQQPFGRSPMPNNDTFGPWAAAASSGNVWGSSGIGNGTFESSNVFAPMPTSQQGSALPPPPGMTRAAGTSRISPQSLGSESRSPNLNQHSVAESSRTFAPPGLEGARPDSFGGQGRVNGTSPVPGLGRQPHLPGPIAPPSRAPQRVNLQQQQVQRQDPLSAWNSAAQSLPHQYKADAAAAEQKPKESMEAPRDDTFKETFRQTATDQGKLGAPRKYDKTEFTIHEAQGSRSVQTLSPVPPSSQTQPPGPFSATSPMPQDTRQMVTEKTVRIPDPAANPAHGGQLPQQPPIAPPRARQRNPPTQNSASILPTSAPRVDSKDPSPPPPETALHPVNSGDASHPHVKLPPEKPKVKLPPSQASAAQNTGPQHPIVLPQRPISNAWGPPGSSKPIVMQEAWQARFNGLFGRAPVQTETPPSPPKTPPKMQGPSPTVTASSRALMDEVPGAMSATVSLPAVARKVTTDGFTLDESSEAVSKPMIQQMFKEEQSFGSAPKVHLPRYANYHVDTLDEPPSHNMLQMLANHKDAPLRVFAQSERILDLTQVHPVRREGYYVSIPGTKLFRRLVRSHNGSSKTSASTQQDRQASGKYKGKGKDGDSSTSTPTVSATLAAGKTSSQKSSTPASQSPAPSNDAPTGTVKKTAWAKPPKGPPRGRGRGPPTVKAA